MASSEQKREVAGLMKGLKEMQVDVHERVTWRTKGPEDEGFKTLDDLHEWRKSSEMKLRTELFFSLSFLHASFSKSETDELSRSSSFLQLSSSSIARCKISAKRSVSWNLHRRRKRRTKKRKKMKQTTAMRKKKVSRIENSPRDW